MQLLGKLKFDRKKIRTMEMFMPVILQGPAWTRLSMPSYTYDCCLLVRD